MGAFCKVVLVTVVALVPHAGLADGGASARLRHLAVHAQDFRVRAQATLSLGRAPTPRDARVLIRAAGDRHYVVRAAAIQGLARVRTGSARRALRVALLDPVRLVRAKARQALQRQAALSKAKRPAIQSSARYHVTLGKMSNKSGRYGKKLSRALHREVAYHLQREPHVLLATVPSEVADGVASIRIEGNVIRVERRWSGKHIEVRCEVSLFLLDDNRSSLRGVVKGTASGHDVRGARPRVQERELTLAAMTAAVENVVAQAAEAIPRIAAPQPELVTSP